MSLLLTVNKDFLNVKDDQAPLADQSLLCAFEDKTTFNTETYVSGQWNRFSIAPSGTETILPQGFTEANFISIAIDHPSSLSVDFQFFDLTIEDEIGDKLIKNVSRRFMLYGQKFKKIIVANIDAALPLRGKYLFLAK